MDKAQKNSVKITGEGQANGGDYERVSITGEAVISGTVSCETFSCTGNCTISEGIQAGRFRVQGEAVIDGELRADDLKSLGEITVRGHVRGGKLTIRGALTASGDCEADKIACAGVLQVNGLVSADEVELKLYGPSKVETIAGERIKVRRTAIQSLKQWLQKDGAAELRADAVEGDIVQLSYTIVQSVRGKQVEIGPGCEVGLVEYSQSLTVHPGSTVRRWEKV